jgi:hypothetical protein
MCAILLCAVTEIVTNNNKTTAVNFLKVFIFFNFNLGLFFSS